MNIHTIHRQLQGGGGGGGGGVVGKSSDALSRLIVRGMIAIFGPEITAGIFISLFVFLCIDHCKSKRKLREKIKRQRRENREWVKMSCSTATAMQFPSAEFRGYYRQYGRDHSLFEFRLEFKQHTVVNGVGVLSGQGKDKVGGYTINGIFNCYSGRVAFTKKYYRGWCCNSNENLGHEVEYQGCVQGCLAAGIRGNWVVSTRFYSGNGEFHIWPAQPVHSSANVTRNATFTATDDNECVVCFDSNVNSVVRPCGHISMCSGCARKVTKCPICRGYIGIIEPYFPSATILDV